MASTTSNTTSFSMDVDDIIEQALEPLGGEYTNGPDMSKARRVLNLLLIQLQNKNIPLNKIVTSTLALQASTGSYDIDSSIVDILELSITESATGTLEIPLERIGRREFHTIPNKTDLKRPTTWTTQRDSDAISLQFWPIPDKVYNVNMLVSTKIEDINQSFQKIDLSYRYYPLVVKWLSYELAITKPSTPTEIVMRLKAERDEAMMDAFDEDRERTDMIVTPGGISGR